MGRAKNKYDRKKQTVDNFVGKLIKTRTAYRLLSDYHVRISVGNLDIDYWPTTLTCRINGGKPQPMCDTELLALISVGNLDIDYWPTKINPVGINGGKPQPMCDTELLALIERPEPTKINPVGIIWRPDWLYKQCQTRMQDFIYYEKLNSLSRYEE